MKRDIRDFLHDIIFYASKAQEVALRDSIKISSYSDEGMIMMHCLQVIGEAVKKIPTDLRAKYPEIPWKRVAGLRDRIAHDYWGTDMNLILFVVRENLPSLCEVVSKMISEIEENP
ncbi:MAG: HepT-like ribonuclease domain-containing protein [Saprospiraceae bacterium]|nr:HepT-like ribonuclease domain-containing protein [Saprospiraceae bacterium]